MRVVSLVFRVLPEQIPTARTGLEQIPGVQVHAEDFDAGRMIVTVEDGEGYSVADSIIAAHQVPQVLSATLAYEFNGDNAEDFSPVLPTLQPATGVQPCH
ncbi:MAG TPA: chaperone NapD [Pseudomonas sp.]|jgi:nitrate reductase NapD|nr:chaperone NapD [Pseudomonas sp.]